MSEEDQLGGRDVHHPAPAQSGERRRAAPHPPGLGELGEVVRGRQTTDGHADTGVVADTQNTTGKGPHVDPAPLTGGVRRGGRYRSVRSTGYRAHSHYTPDDLEDRAKNAWYWTQLEEGGFNTKSELVIAGMSLVCEMLEDLYNGGQPFPAAPEQTRRGPSPAGAARQSAAMRDWWDKRAGTASTEPTGGTDV